MLCAGVTTYNSLRNMNITAGDVVAIQGIGGLGHLAIQYARKMGFRTVALSTSDSKREFAKELGANDYINTSNEDAAEALQKMGGASCIIVTAPSPVIMGPLVGGLGPRGKLLILAGKCHKPCSLNCCPDIIKLSGTSLWTLSSSWRREHQFMACRQATLSTLKKQSHLHSIKMSIV